MGAFISIFPNQFKAPTALKPAATGSYLLFNVQIINLLFTLTVQKDMYSSVSKVLVGSFRVSVIHQTLTWTTGSLKCVRDHSYASVYTRSVGTPTVQYYIFDSKNSQMFFVLLMGFEVTDVRESRVRCSTN